MPYGPPSDLSTTAPTRVPASRRPRAKAPRAAAHRRAARALRYAAPALLAYAAVRVLGLLVLAVWARREHRELWHLLAESWDCDWYLRIAADGYADTLGHAFDTNNLAFFPLFPLLIRAGDALLPAPRGGVGLALAVGCSFLAAWGIFKVGDRLHGRRAGVLLVTLWACLPVALVQWMGYTESLFTALAAWSLYAVLTGRWVWAGALAALAGLTRPTGVAVAAAVSLTALLALRRRFDARALTGALLAPLGWLAYVGWVGARLGRWDGYFAVQKLWHNEWDGGIGTLRWMKRLFLVERPQLFLVLVTLVLLGALVLYVLSVAGREQPLPLLVFTGLLVAIVLGSSGVYFPRARFLLPGFPLLLPVALALARARTRVTLAVLSTAALTSAAFGGHMLLVWLGPP
ncbi:glycosyltransferase family 39 protein [Streptomyces flavofungini]|uniref:glycosyltransferase family 39 protein n=1 Tax=Streptomyces flavofungini TaxID=68200 RepID=UPI0019B725F0|nr:glycosyltransferase family 39 protein [Streptomyces flavofungini]GHC49642.1 membrane protein [Streptomyces flavofungini]